MKKLANQDSLVGKIISFVPGSILPAVVALLTMSVFTRLLSKAEYGNYSLALSYITFLLAISSQWLQQSINRFLPGETNQGKKEIYIKAIVTGLIYVSLFLIVFNGISLLVFKDYFKSWNQYIVPAVLLLLSTLLYQTVSTLLQSQLRGKFYSYVNSINAVIKFLLGVTFISMVQLHGEGLIWAAFISQTLMVVAILKKLELPSLKGLFQDSKIKGALNEFFVYGFPMIGWFLSSTLLDLGDRFVIQYFKGAGEVGIYSATYTLIQGGVGLIAAPVLLAAHPFLMKAWGEKDNERTKLWLTNIINWFWVFIFALCGTIWFMSNEISSLFLGKAFAGGKTIMPVVLAGFVFWQLGSYAHKPLEFHNKTVFLMTANIAVAVVNVILNVLSVPHWGYQAAAYSTFISYLLYYIIVSIASRKYLRVSIDVVVILKYLVIICIFYATFYFGLDMFQGLNFYLLFLIKLILSGLFMGIITLKVTKKYLLIKDSSVN